MRNNCNIVGAGGDPTHFWANCPIRIYGCIINSDKLILNASRLIVDGLEK